MRNVLPITYHLSRQEGQSLVEVVVALGVVVLVVLALVRGTVTSIRNATFAKNRSLATKYSQEALEKVRSYRDQNSWQDFTINCNSISLDTPSSPLVPALLDCHLPGSTSNCSESEDSCEVKVTVSWADAQGTHQSELITRLTNWK